MRSERHNNPVGSPARLSMAERQERHAPSLPLFFCPIEPAVHPEVNLLQQRALLWLEAWSFFGRPDGRARSLASRSAEFAGRMTPSALTERLQIATEWTYWGFAFDDAYCDTKPWCERPAEFAERAGRVIRLLEAPGYAKADPNPYIGALAELSERFRAVATPVQHRRWVHAQRAWLSGVGWQIANQARGIMPSLDDYLAIRINSAAGEPVTSMIEIVNGTELPATEMDSLPVRACTEMSRLLASLDNDVHSYAKDAWLDESDQNIVNVLATERRLTLPQALCQAIAIRDRIMCRFLVLREFLSPHCGSATRQYLDDLGHVVRGNLDWGLNTPRYLVDGAQADVFTYRDTASDTSTLPPTPSIAWWWDSALTA